MPRAEKLRARAQSIDEQVARLRMKKIRLIAHASQTEPKRDTRRKILIGGALLAAIDHEGLPAMRSKADLLRWLDRRLTRPYDREIFDLPSPETPSARLQPSAV